MPAIGKARLVLEIFSRTLPARRSAVPSVDSWELGAAPAERLGRPVSQLMWWEGVVSEKLCGPRKGFTVALSLTVHNPYLHGISLVSCQLCKSWKCTSACPKQFHSINWNISPHSPLQRECFINTHTHTFTLIHTRMHTWVHTHTHTHFLTMEGRENSKPFFFFNNFTFETGSCWNSLCRWPSTSESYRLSFPRAQPF